MTHPSAVNGFRGPELPDFLRVGAVVTSAKSANGENYLRLLNRLKGELGFQERDTAMRWLMEQLEESTDLRRTILLLLQQGSC